MGRGLKNGSERCIITDMKIKDISAHVVCATRAHRDTTRGLISIQMEIPLYVWTELLTHRRFSRNASSARAMSTKRYTDMGYYVPDTWYRQGDGMQSGESIADDSVYECIDAYEYFMRRTTEWADHLGKRFSLAKEQRNRLIPPIKIVRGIVTGTEDAWYSFLRLRDNSMADVAMQKLAHRVAESISAVEWNYGYDHKPFYDDSIVSSVARIARVSYNRESGKDDATLYDMLLREKHLSPFEHIAQWKPDPYMSNFTCKREDVILDTQTHDVQWWKNQYSGWQSYRSEIETLGELIII